MRQPTNGNKRGRVTAADGTVAYTEPLPAGTGRSASWVVVKSPAFRRQHVSGSKAIIRDLQHAGLLPR